MSDADTTLRIGWASADLTPTEPVVLAGQFHARISEGVADPLSATVMAFDSLRDDSGDPGRGVLISCDLVNIPDSLRGAVCDHLRRDLPELDAELVCMNATHTHTGPEVRSLGDARDARGASIAPDYGVELDIMPAAQYSAMIARRIADAVIQAWRSRQPAAVGFGLGHASIAYNRRLVYDTGETKMYGGADKPEFSHLEGGTDTGVHVVGVWNADDRLTGVIINVPCPSQTSEHEWQVSADYWHEVRQEMRSQLGDDLFILAQCSPAGDLTPGRRTTMIDWRAQERMWRLMNVSQRRDIARRITQAVTDVLPYIHADRRRDPVVRHRADVIDIPRRLLSRADVDSASALADKFRQRYNELLNELNAHPDKRNEPRWYCDITTHYRQMRWNLGVADRYEDQKQNPTQPTRVHVIRIGDLAIATNQFEYYLDFAHRIRARSPAVQTMLVQLAGPGTYLPTQRAVAGGSYGAVPASTPVGPEGGRELAEWTLRALSDLWHDASA